MLFDALAMAKLFKHTKSAQICLRTLLPLAAEHMAVHPNPDRDRPSWRTPSV